MERARTAGLDADTLLEASGPKLEAQGEVYRLIEVAGKRLPSTVEAATRQLRLDSIRQELAEIDRRLGDFDHHARSDYAAPTLRKAILARDVAKYAQAHERLVDLHNRLSSREKRGKLLERLKRIAPAWAAAIQRREGLHGAERPPSDPRTAWRWRVLNDELERRAAVDPTALQATINRLEDDLRRVTAELVSRRAWAARSNGPRTHSARN